MTKKQAALLSVLRESEGHMTAEQVYLACKKAGVEISLASVYRCLAALADEGHVRRFVVTGEPEYFDKTTSEHEHLFCSSCRRVMDARGRSARELLEETYGVTLTSYDLSMHVVCPDCAARKGA